MRSAQVSLLAFLRASIAVAQVRASEDDQAVIRSVLAARALPELIRNWGLEPDSAEVVLSNRLAGCVLPPSEAESKRVTDALNRAARGETVPEDQFRYRSAIPGADLVIADGRVIPSSLVRQCQTEREFALLPVLAIGEPIRVILEEHGAIASEFRQNEARWKQRHPFAVGVISFGRPTYSKDRAFAALSYSRLRDGIGGGVFFCMLRRSGEVWEVQWQETVLIE